MDVEERHKICRLIEAVIAADGVVASAEREYLRKIIERFGLPARDASAPLADNVARLMLDPGGAVRLLVESALAAVVAAEEALEDGDEVTISYTAPGVLGGRLALGEVVGRVLPTVP